LPFETIDETSEEISEQEYIDKGILIFATIKKK